MKGIFPGNVDVKNRPSGLPHPYELERYRRVYFFIYRKSGMRVKQIGKWFYFFLGKLEKHMSLAKTEVNMNYIFVSENKLRNESRMNPLRGLGL